MNKIEYNRSPCTGTTHPLRTAAHFLPYSGMEIHSTHLRGDKMYPDYPGCANTDTGPGIATGFSKYEII